MSDQLAAASQAMNVPEPLVERSAHAWATATGSEYEDVLTAWAGGEAVAADTAPAAPAEEEAEPAPSDEEAPEPTAEPAPPPEPSQPAEPAEPRFPVPAAPAAEPEPDVEPLPLGERLRLAGRVGAWTGATLGLLGLVLASTWLLGVAAVAGEEGAFAPAVEVTTSRFMLGTTLMSIVFGVVVATFSRTAAGWVAAGARLDGRNAITVGIGAVLGLVLGLAASAVMVSAFAEPVSDGEGISLIRVVPGIFVVLLGGALLGWVTAVLVQVLGVPVGLNEADAEEISEVRGRLSAALNIPVAAVALLVILVLPLGLVFIRSNEMATGGAAVLAVFAAAAILGIAAMSASRPTMRVTLGEFLVAVAGIATVVLIIFAVIQTQAGPAEEEPAAEGDTAEEQTEDEAAAPLVRLPL